MTSPAKLVVADGSADVLTTLLDRTEGDAALPLSPQLREQYGGALSFPAGGQPYVFANFVSTIDGVVSFGLPGRAHANLISGGYAGDRFVLGLLRAVADAIIVGAGTLRKEPGVTWAPEAAFPESGRSFGELRNRLGKRPRALTVLVSGSGEVDLGAPAFAEGTPVVILTTEKGARALTRLPPQVRVRTLLRGSTKEMVDIAVAESGGALILTEGGPTLFGQFLRERTVDELFLTIAPLVAGHTREAAHLSLVERTVFLPEDAPRPTIRSVKASGDYLFLRFAMRAAQA